MPSSSGLLGSVFVDKDVCFTPGFDRPSPAESASGFAEVAAAFRTYEALAEV